MLKVTNTVTLVTRGLWKFCKARLPEIEGLTDQLLKQRRVEAFHGVEAHPTIADMDL